MDSQPRQVTVHYFLLNPHSNDGLACFIDGYAAAGFVGMALPPGTFRLKVLKGNGMGLDLWKSYLVAKSEGPTCAGLGGFGATSSLAGWVG